MEILGLAGLTILVSVFLFQAIGFFANRKLPFYFFNAIGAGMLAYYAGVINNFYFVILESVWCTGAIISFGTNMFKNYRAVRQIRQV